MGCIYVIFSYTCSILDGVVMTSKVQALQMVIYKKPTDDITDPKAKIQSRQTEEIILAVCGYVGAGVSNVAATLGTAFAGFGYDVCSLKVSDIIRDICGIQKPAEKSYKYIVELQDRGNELRKKYKDNSYLAQCIIEKISRSRVNGRNADEVSIPESRRRITIIDSLKHPEEYELLSLIYGEMFFLVGVICPDDKRRERLINIGFSRSDVEKCIARDRKQSEAGGQNTAETLFLSDFFVDNANDTENSNKEQLERFVEIVMGKRSHSPTNDEYAMYCAHATALRSGCLSRQVGASILKDGVLIATGRNDVPKNCGGLYCEDNTKDDHRCLKLNPPECKSDNKKKRLIAEISGSVHENWKESKESLIEKIVSQIAELPQQQKTVLIEKIKQQLSSNIEEEDFKIAEKIYKSISSNVMIKSLVEYSRAVHAEMDAITSVARTGGISLKGATLYCTTFPCHHCARHILSSGIKQVIYIEPYDKSLAFELHKDSIAVDVSPTTETKKLHMDHFKGVAPKRYASLFRYDTRKNKSGRRLECDQNESKPYLQKLMDSFIDYELKVVDLKNEHEHNKG